MSSDWFEKTDNEINEVDKQEYLLQPGYLILPERAMLIYMILGSCVAVIISNKAVDKTGICHFIRPNKKEDDKPRSVYGTVAVITLIKMLLEKGGSIGDLEAQVIGGGDLPGRSLGEENAEMALKILKKRGVHVASQDTGGNKGRKVIFNTDNNNLAVIKVDKIRTDDWYPSENAHDQGPRR